MVASRTRFLSQGYYQPVVDSLLQVLHDHGLTPETAATIMDAGCGEGFYTDAIARHFAASSVCGFDIARPAVLAATRRNRAIQWLVASVSDIPLQGEQCDVIISIFSRTDWSEFARLLNRWYCDNANAGQGHLLGLRQAIYDTVRPYPEDKRLQDLPAELQVVQQLSIQHEMQLRRPSNHGSTSNDSTIGMLFTQKAQLVQRESLLCALDMRLSVITKSATNK